MASQSRTKRRYNTVHDLTSLRLHPDGSRVATKPSRANQPSMTLYARSVRRSGKDARGNWIARDAAGLGRVKKLKRADGDEERGEKIDIAIGEEEGEGNDGKDGKKRDEKMKTARGEKRRRFEQDIELLQGSIPEAIESAPDDGPSTLPTPSSDLLKCVHHFASHYYTARGVLLDNGRGYRKEKKARKEQREKEIGDLFGEEQGDSDEEDEDEDEMIGDRGTNEPGDEQNDDEKEGDGHGEEDGGRTERGKGKARKKRKDPARDMYKAFDGSALMAIGMLLQEHVSQLLAPNVLPGWEDGMAAEGKIVDSDSDDDVKPCDHEGYEEDKEESSSAGENDGESSGMGSSEGE